MSSKLIGSGRWIQTRTGPLALDPHQAIRVQDNTGKVYRAAGREFTAWVRKHRLTFDTAAEADDLLVEYKNAPDGLSASSSPILLHFSHCIAFVEYVFRALGRQQCTHCKNTSKHTANSSFAVIHACNTICNTCNSLM